MERVLHYPLGDRAIVFSFGNSISEEVNSYIKRVTAALDSWTNAGFLEYVPAYTTITVYYDPLVISYDELQLAFYSLLANLPEIDFNPSCIKEIPVYYNGPDLAFVAQFNGLSQEEVIQIHCDKLYRVFMIGFVPGFPYLGGMDGRIATARKEVPRLKVEAGAVGIAGQQTGIYPMETPGGWQIVGHTPLQIFNIENDMPSFLEAGDQVRFVSISKDVFDQLKQNQNGG